MGRKYDVDKISIKSLLGNIEQGRITMPEIQRTFVWNSSKVRDLIDSISRGFPVGYIITRQNPHVRLKDGTTSQGKHVLIDGQQAHPLQSHNVSRSLRKKPTTTTKTSEYGVPKKGSLTHDRVFENEGTE